MKKSALILALAALATTFTATAQDLVIPTNHDAGTQILSDAKFDPVGNNIGNTNANTKLCIGEVDFGTDGANYKAASIYLANGWNVDGWAILSAGNTIDDAKPFVQLGINETGGYDHYQFFGSNLSVGVVDSLLSGGKPAYDSIQFTKPVGVQKVFVTFVGGAGNIKSINFYKNALTAADFVSSGYDKDIRILNPNEREGYDQISAKLLGTASTLVSSPSTDTKWDNDSWGWTKEGVIVNYGSFDFGTAGTYKQLVAYLKHWGQSKDDHLTFYIDSVADGNQIADIFTGLNNSGNGPWPYAKNLTREVSGTHNVFVLWHGGSTNLADVEFVEQQVWPEQTDNTVVVVNDTPASDAFHFTYVGSTWDDTNKVGQGDPWTYYIKNKGQHEGAGNIGYTGNGTVIEFPNVNFSPADNFVYNKIYVNHACDKSWTDYIENSNFSFYIDLEDDAEGAPATVAPMATIDWSNADQRAALIADKTPIAVVRLQGTGSWGTRAATSAPLSKVEGVHNLYMFYNTPTTNAGANVFDIYLEGSIQTGVTDVNAATLRAYGTTGAIVTSVDAQVYSITGAYMGTAHSSLAVPAGVYVVKAGNKAVKVLVK